MTSQVKRPQVRVEYRQNNSLVADSSIDTEDSNGMSRSSSVSTKDRALPSRRVKSGKQRRDDSESFDVRSQYTPFYPQQQQPTWASTPSYNPMSVNQFNGPVAGSFQASGVPQFGYNPQQYGQPTMSANVPPYQMPQVSCLESFLCL